MNVLTLGTFDLFHAGHVQLLRRCREMAGRHGMVTVGLNSDAFIAAFKRTPPVVGYAGRAAVLRACRYVDMVIPNAQDARGSSAGPTIDVSRAEVIVVGSDWQHHDYLGQLGIDAEWLAGRKVTVAYVPYGEGSGSTGIKARVIELAAPYDVRIVMG